MADYKFLTRETFDDGQIVRILSTAQRPATRRAAAFSSSSGTRSPLPRPTTRCASSS